MFVPMITQWRAEIGERPTNAQALAMLSAAGSPPLPVQDMDLAETTIRYIWAAFGYLKPGDKFAIATNARHWRAPYPIAKGLYTHLLTIGQASDRFLLSDGQTDTIPILDPDLAAGKPAAIAPQLSLAWDLLKQYRAGGGEPIPPGQPTYPIPGTPVRIPSKRPPIPKVPLPSPGTGSGKALVLIALVAAAIMFARRGR